MFKRLAAMLCLLAASAHAEAPAPPWQSSINADHPLVGRIWSPDENRWLTQDELLRRMSDHRYVLLGETHDNADHHRLQAWLGERLADGPARPSLVFEMIDSSQSAALQAWLERPAGSLPDAIGWAESGWPDWSLYEPIFAAALAEDLPIKAGNLPREEVREVMRGAAPPLDIPPLEGQLQEALIAEIAASHCDMLPESILPGMALAQQLRDLVMAEALQDAQSGQAILIAGWGHVRKDRGVPYYLPKGSSFALAFMQVAEDSDIAEFDNAPFDAVWFTPRASDDDPCASMRGG